MLNNINDLILVANKQEDEEPLHEVLEYIQLDGTQYFDTGMYYDLNTQIEAGIAFTSIPTQNTYIFGARGSAITTGANVNNIDCIFAKDMGMVCDFNNSNYDTYRLSVPPASLTANEFYDVIINKSNRQILLDGVSKGSNTTVNSDTFDSVNTICIGIVNGMNIDSYVGFNGNIKYFKIDEHDYVPALDYLLRPCLYDKVTKTFLYAKKISNGTTTYDLGYKRWNKFDVDYIESDGNQFIDTGYIPSGTTETEILVMPTDQATARFLFGCRTGQSNNIYACLLNSVQRIGYRVGASGAYLYFSNYNEVNVKHTYKISNGVFYRDGVIVSSSCEGASVAPSAPLALLTINTNNTFDATQVFKGYFYYCTIKENGILVRDYKPVVWHNSDTTAVACLYDEVYNKMYENAGTGSFKAYISAERTVYNLSMHDTMDITIGNGAYISANGVVTADTASSYTQAIPVQEGDVITLTVTGRATTAAPYNKRIHGYTTDDGTIATGSKGSWVQQLDYINFPQGQTEYSTQTISVTIPSGVNYIRLSHAITMETQCDLTVTRTYEVGKSIENTGTAYIATGIHPTEDTGVRIIYNYTSNSSSLSAGVTGTWNGDSATTLNVTSYSGSTETTTTIGMYHKAQKMDRSTTTGLPNIVIGVRHIASINYLNSGEFNLDETWKRQFGETGTILNEELRLFGRCRNGSYSNTRCAIGYTEFTEDKEFLAKLVPVRNATVTADVGVFNKVNNEYITTPIDSLSWNSLD